MEYSLLFVILLIILGIEVIKLCGNVIETFASFTENRLSNYEVDHETDKFANDGEEILLITQEPNKQKKIEFSDIRTTLNKWIVVRVKSNKSGDYKQISNFSPIQIKKINNKTLNLLGQNKYFMTDGTAIIKYYIVFLNDELLQKELQRIVEINNKKQKYDSCIKLNIGISEKSAIAKCSEIL